MFSLIGILPPSAANHLTGVSVSAPFQTTGAPETWTVTFTTHQNVPAGGLIAVDFPDAFTLNMGAATACDIEGIVGETTTIKANSYVECNLPPGIGIPEATPVRVYLTAVRNPVVAGLTAAFVISTGFAGGAGDPVFLDIDATNQEMIAPSTLSNFVASGGVQTTGASTTWQFGFTTFNAVEPNGDLRFVFPPGFFVSPNVACTIAGKATSTVRASNGSEVLCKLSAVTNINGGEVVSASLSNIQNPSVAHTTSAFLVQTRDPNGGVHDQHGTNVEDITAHAFTSGPAYASSSQVAGATALRNFTVTAFNAWGSDGKFRVAFPTGFAFNTGGTTTASFTSGGSGTLGSPVVSGSTITFTRSGGSSIAGGSALTIQFTNVRNPTSTGTTGNFTVSTLNATGATHDSGTAPGVNITSGSTTSTTTTSTSSSTSATSPTTGSTTTSTGGEESSTGTDASTSEETAPLSSTSSETTNETDEGEAASGGSPGLGPVLILGVLLAIVAVCRRRE